MSVKLGLLTLRKELGLKEFENGVLKGICAPKRDEIIGAGENCIMRSFITCTLRQV
jgi:hypothetical protein